MYRRILLEKRLRLGTDSARATAACGTPAPLFPLFEGLWLEVQLQPEQRYPRIGIRLIGPESRARHHGHRRAEVPVIEEIDPAGAQLDPPAFADGELL